MIRQAIDWIWTSALTVGSSQALLLRPLNGVLEVRNLANTDYADLQAKRLVADTLALTNPIAPPVRRQCIQVGSVDSLGRPTALINPINLTMQVGGDGTLIFAFADGFSATGTPIDLISTVTSSQTIAAIANTTTYFYAQYSTPTAVTLGTTTLRPIYSRTPPASPATGQHWFNTNANSVGTSAAQAGMRMFEWTGSAWAARQRIFVGEATAGGSSVTSFACYAYQRRYQSAWTAGSAAATINFAHRLGMPAAEAEALIQVYCRSNSGDANSVMAPPYYFVGGLGYGVSGWTTTNARLNQSILLGDGGIFFNGSSWVTSAELQMTITGGW